ncbi:MAG: hypothetical protein IT203_04350 [Fimbriimonadaceae bacterium]|nr:hypothetical protein [Fimbriimonadaceae bacterium]
MSEVPPNYAAYPRQTDPRQYFGPPCFRFDAIGEAWQILKSDMATWVVAVFLIMIIAVAVHLPASIIGTMEAIQNVANPRPPSAFVQLMNFAFGMLGAGVATVLYAGLFRVAFQRMRLQYEGVAGLFNAAGQGWNLFAWGALTSIPSLALSAILTAVSSPAAARSGANPFANLGIIGILVLAMLLIGLLFFPFFLVPAIVVDQKIPLLEAAMLSWRTVSKQFFVALGVYLVAVLAAGLGVFACFIGVFFTAPIIYLTIAIMYRDHFIPPIATEAPICYPPTAPGFETG